VIVGDVVSEVRQVFGAYATQVTRIYADKPYAEVEYTLGPIDVSDGQGREVITKFVSGLKSASKFFTDANGREVLERTLNTRATWPLQVHEPESGNYYPVNTRIFIQDKAANSQFTVISDRTQGGSSLVDGEVELMVNRRTTHDDWRGVGEALNEDIVVRGKYWIFFDTIENSLNSHRLFAERLQNSLAPFFSVGSTLSEGFSLVGKPVDLPENIHVVSFEQSGPQGQGLLRLAHLFANGESKKYSTTETIDVGKVFGVDIIDELSLSANQKLGEMKRLQWQAKDSKVPSSGPVASSIVAQNVVEIKPMEIRTFLVQFPRPSPQIA